MQQLTKDFGSRYYATSDGKVFSKGFYYEVRNQTGDTGSFIYKKEKELKGGVTTGGYRQVMVDNKLTLVHKIVAELFLPNPLGLPEINHIDGNKLNNNITNLEWCSRSYNIQHAYDNNLNQGVKGETNGKSKLTTEVVLNIVNEYINTGLSQDKIAKKYSIRQITVSNIITGRSWSHVTGIPKRSRT